MDKSKHIIDELPNFKKLHPHEFEIQIRIARLEANGVDLELAARAVIESYGVDFDEWCGEMAALNKARQNLEDLKRMRSVLNGSPGLIIKGSAK